MGTSPGPRVVCAAWRERRIRSKFGPNLKPQKTLSQGGPLGDVEVTIATSLLGMVRLETV